MPRHRQAPGQQGGARQAAGAPRWLGKPMIIRSAYRRPEHNRAVGGAKASKHSRALPSTSRWRTTTRRRSRRRPARSGSRASATTALGLHPHRPRAGAQLGRAVPKRATAFAVETPPAREVLAESRTLKGSGAAGVATIGAAGIEVAQEALAETQGAILPLVPYLDTLRWLFIAVALVGIAVTIYAGWMTGRRGRR